MYMSAQCTNYMDGCASWIHGVHALSSKHPLTIASVLKSIKSTDKGLFTKNNVLLECCGEHWCQMLYWLVVTRQCNTLSLVECSHLKTMLGQQEALEWIIVPIGLPSCSICCSSCIPFQSFSRSLRHKIPTVATYGILCFYIEPSAIY